MPYCRSLGNGLWEVRSALTDGKIGRVIFCVTQNYMVLLHGFVKKTQKRRQFVDVAANFPEDRIMATNRTAKVRGFWSDTTVVRLRLEWPHPQR